MAAARTMFEKIWQRHVVVDRDDGYTLLYIDRHLMHDGSAAGFAKLRERGMKLRRPDRGFATPDHYVRSDSRDVADIVDPHHRKLVEVIRTNTAESGVTLFDLGDERQGIAHVVGPEQGVTQPGLTLVCGDSHTSTHGALGALAFGIGSSEVAHVMATQCLWQRKPKAMRISVDGTLGEGITGKDVILAIIAKIGTAGAVGHVIEYAGSAIRGLSIEGRLTVCNMSIEAGGRAGMVAPDDTTIAYLKGRPFCAEGVRMGQGRRLLAHRAERRGRRLRSRRQPRRGVDHADGHLGHQPRGRAVDHRPHSRALDGAGQRQEGQHEARARLYGPGAGHAARAGAGRSRLHRLLHQQPHRGPARRRQGRQGPQGRDPVLGGRGLGPGEEAGRGRRARQDLPSRPASNGASRAARCASA